MPGVVGGKKYWNYLIHRLSKIIEGAKPGHLKEREREYETVKSSNSYTSL
jgi:hypothetical protein